MAQDLLQAIDENKILLCNKVSKVRLAAVSEAKIEFFYCNSKNVELKTVATILQDAAIDSHESNWTKSLQNPNPDLIAILHYNRSL